MLEQYKPLETNFISPNKKQALHRKLGKPYTKHNTLQEVKDVHKKTGGVCHACITKVIVSGNFGILRDMIMYVHPQVQMQTTNVHAKAIIQMNTHMHKEIKDTTSP